MLGGTDGGSVTVSEAALLVLEPPVAVVATARYRRPFIETEIEGTLKDVPVAPAMFCQEPPLSVETCHCKAGTGSPDTATLKVAVWPVTPVKLDGCWVNTGGASGVTVSVAAELVSENVELFVTLTRN